MSRNSRTAAEVRRELNNLQLRLRRGEITPAMHNRLSDKLILELNGIAPANPSEYLNDAALYGTSVGYRITTDSSSKVFSPEDWERVRTYFGIDMAAREQSMTGVFRYSFPSTRDDKSIAEMAWEEHGGIVTCECESMDCTRIIEITKEEYLHASTPGYRRLTHPECPYGIVNSRLMERKPKWSVWDKGW